MILLYIVSRKMANTDKINFRYLILQILPVMIGVYLGFWMNEKSLERKGNAEKVKLEQMLLTEIKSNQAEVLKKQEYHNMLIDSFTVLMSQSGDIEFDRVFKFFKGLNTPMIKASAFESGIQSGLLSKLGLDQMASLNELYEEQRSLNRYAESAIQALLTTGNLEASQARNMIQRLMLNLRDIIAFEERLGKRYETTLEQFE